MGDIASGVSTGANLVVGIADSGPSEKNLAIEGNIGFACKRVATTNGIAVEFPNNGSYYAYNSSIPTDWITGTKQWSILTACRFNSINGGGAINSVAAQRYSGTGWIFGEYNGNWLWYDNNNSFNSFGFDPPVGQELVALVTADGTNNLTIYTSFGNASITLGGALPTPDAGFQLGAFSGSNGPFDGTVALFAMGPRWTPQGQAQSYIQNPWQMFRPPSQRLWYGTSAAPAANWMYLDPLIYGGAM
jgi:hypothetical protein